MRDQILMHLSNGFNGPSIIGAWLAYVLATHPDVEEKLIAEIDGITGGDPDYDLQYDDLMTLTYTTQVIKETMRIYPPMPVTIRRSLKDGMLGRYRVRKGDIILVGTLAAQRDPRYWGPDADRFDPEQFAMEKVVGRPRHAFIPFSIGRRQCMAQEVTFMMLRVVLFEIYKHYRLRLAPGATVTKNTIVTTKPAAVPITRLPREPKVRSRAAVASHDRPAPAPAVAPEWGEPTEIPKTSAYRHLVVAYGSNFGANKELAERFAERSDFHGYTSDVITLNELAESPPRTQPWLLVVMTSTYTSNPPPNATAVQGMARAHGTWWSDVAELPVPRLGARQQPVECIPRVPPLRAHEAVRARRHAARGVRVRRRGLARVGAPARGLEQPRLACPPRAVRGAADGGRGRARRRREGGRGRADGRRLEHRDAQVAPGDDAAPQPVARATSVSSIMRRMSSGSRQLGRRRSASGHRDRMIGVARSRGYCSPRRSSPTPSATDTVEARVLVCRELLAPDSPKRTRHLEISLPPGVAYQVGDHLGVCPKNDEERVERLARHLGAALDGLLHGAEHDERSAQCRRASCSRSATCSPASSTSPAGRRCRCSTSCSRRWPTPPSGSRLVEITDVLQTPDARDSPLRAAINAGGYDVLQLLDEFRSCSLNMFEFLQVAQPLRPRYYSTSSSPRIHGDDIAHVTVGLEITSVQGMPDHDFAGCARTTCTRFGRATA